MANLCPMPCSPTAILSINCPDARRSHRQRLLSMSKIHVQCTINGEPTEFLCEARQSLLEVLREELGFTGTKEGCNDGNCGACSVTVSRRLSVKTAGPPGSFTRTSSVSTRTTAATWNPLRCGFMPPRDSRLGCPRTLSCPIIHTWPSGTTGSTSTISRTQKGITIPRAVKREGLR